jgi:hypothetical protein
VAASLSALTFAASKRRAAAIIFSVVASNSGLHPRRKRSGVMHATTKALRQMVLETVAFELLHRLQHSFIEEEQVVRARRTLGCSSVDFR